MGDGNPSQDQEDRAAACLGLYHPCAYEVRIDDTHVQWKFRLASAALFGQTVGIPSFLLWCAEYVIAHHRELKEVRRTIREAERQIAREKRKRERGGSRRNPDCRRRAGGTTASRVVQP